MKINFLLTSVRPSLLISKLANKFGLNYEGNLVLNGIWA